MTLLPIAKVTIKECLRFRMLYCIFGVALVFIVAGKGCNPGTIKGKGILFDDSTLVAFAMGAAFHCIAFWSTVLCGLLAVQVLAREIDSGTAALTLSRPLSRSAFVAGKLLAVILVSALNLFVLGTIFSILFYLENGYMHARIYAGLCVLLVGLVVFALLNMLLSLLLPRIPALMLGLLMYCTAFFCALPTYAVKVTLLWEPSSTISVLHRTLPALGDLQFIAGGMLTRMPGIADVYVAGINIIAYIAALWFATIWLFSKKQL